MKRSLQVRLLATFSIVIIVLAGVGLLVLDHSRSISAFYQSSLSDLIAVAELTQAVHDTAETLGKLASEAVPEPVIEEVDRKKDRIHTLRTSLPPKTVNAASARMMLDLDNLADSFIVEAGAAIYAFRANDLEAYFRHDREAASIAGYVRDTADRLMAGELEAYRNVYPEAIRRDRRLQQTNMAVLAVVTLTAVAFAWSFARSLTDPMKSLARAAGRIAGGNLDGPPVPPGSGDELDVLGQAFNHMQENLREHVADLREKAELERRLQAEELENLQIGSLLKDAELRALQSQVNPHFLFNTLNMVVKMAMIEGADRTCGLLETVADLLRYSLRDLNRPVTLDDEVAQVKRYITIQKERFRERFHFVVDVDESAMETPLPCMTLQPLVENALIHGLGSREIGGEVRLIVRRAGGRVYMTVSDDGVGIPAERLHVLNGGSLARPPATLGDSGRKGHTTGLGLHNVRSRLELFYSQDASLELSSQPGQGTTLTIAVPDPQGR